MPTQQTYYLNGPTLSLATSVFLDSGMTLCAPDGFYSDGTVSREQVGCVLLPAVECPTCGDQCGESIVDLVSNNGVYYVDFDSGTAEAGVIVINLDVDLSVCGIKVDYNGSTYNELSSPIHGYLCGTAGTSYTYIGGVSYDCGIEGTPYTLDEYEYVSPSYNPLGTTIGVTPQPSELALTASDPGLCVMVIPKGNTTPSSVAVTVVGPCPGSVGRLSVSCPIKIPSFIGSDRAITVFPEVFCQLPTSTTYYVVPVNGDGITLGLYDWVFSDKYASIKLEDGYYKSTSVPSPYDTFQVQNGVIIAFHTYCSI